MILSMTWPVYCKRGTAERMSTYLLASYPVILRTAWMDMDAKKPTETLSLKANKKNTLKIKRRRP